MAKGMRPGNYKHGCGPTPLYNIYNQMRYRCRPGNKHPQAKDYAGRGIRVCQEWLDDFMSFQAWALSNGYQHGLCLDRIDVDGNYQPSNCRFVNRKTQQRNRRHNIRVEHNGHEVVLQDILDAYGVTNDSDRKRVQNRIQEMGMGFQEAVDTPLMLRSGKKLSFEGKTLTVKELYGKLVADGRMADQVNFKAFYYRLYRGWDVDEAKDTPLMLQ